MIGRISFWCSWPFWLIYLMIGRRTRVIVASGDEVLLVRGWLGDGKWGLPGGGIHKGEDSLTGALRELHEETGIRLRPEQMKFLGSSVARTSGLRFRYDQYAAVLSGRPAIKPQRLEIISAEWIPVSEISARTADITTINTLNRWNKHR
jgi:8-oxo-dGTP pyrophosphatase MutT (NUDIX family)